MITLESHLLVIKERCQNKEIPRRTKVTRMDIRNKSYMEDLSQTFKRDLRDSESQRIRAQRRDEMKSHYQFASEF